MNRSLVCDDQNVLGHVWYRTFRLVEREDYLTQLERIFAKCKKNSAGYVAVVNGSVGTGKTEFIQELTSRIPGPADLLLIGAGTPSESKQPMALIRQLFRDVALPPGYSDRIAALLEFNELTAPEFSTAATHATKVHSDVCREICLILQDLSESHRLLICIDDAHRADTPSLQCILQLARMIRSMRIMVVLTFADGAQEILPLLHAELLRERYCARMVLEPLSSAGVAEMVTQWLDTPVPVEFLASYQVVSGGNPLLLRALLEDQVTPLSMTGPRDPSGLHVGDAFGLAILACLYRIPASTPQLALSVARSIAVLGPAATPPLIARMLEADPQQVTQIIGVMNRAGLLKDGQFRHQRAHAAVIGDPDFRDRAALHQRAATILNQAGAASSSIAGQILASEITDPWTMPILLDAADQALQDGQIDTAVTFLRRAIPACTNEAERAEATIRLARAEWLTNPSAAMRYLTSALEFLRNGTLSRYHVHTVIRQLLWHGRVEEAIGAYHQLEQASDAERLDSESTVEDYLTRAGMQACYPSLSRRLKPALSDSPSGNLIPVTAVRRVQAVELLASVLAGRAGGDVVSQAEQVLENCRVDDQWLEPAEWALQALICVEQFTPADSWCHALLAEAQRRPAPSWQARLAAVYADVRFRRGDLRGAAAYAEAALTHLSQRSWGVGVGLPLSVRLLTATAMGRYAEADTIADQRVPEAMLYSRFGLHYLNARGHLYLATGRLNAALGDFLTCGELMVEWGIDLPTLIPWRMNAAMTLLGLKSADRARELIDEQLTRPGADRDRTRGSWLRVRAELSDPKHRPSMLRESVGLLHRAGDRVELARALADLSQAYQAVGEVDRARMFARRSSHLAMMCHAEPLSGRHYAEFVKTGGTERPEPIDVAEEPVAAALSGAERRIAEMAAVGHTNREIAAKLCVTVSTVEQHLTRVYRKLRIKRRAELPNKLSVARVQGPDERLFA